MELDDGDDATQGAGDRRGRSEMGPVANELRPGRLHGRSASSARAAAMVGRAPRVPADGEATAVGD
jgi:hypothetical protein